MNLDMLFEYLRWSDRGHLPRLTCLEHNINLIPALDGEGLVLLCGLCDYKNHLGYKDYKVLEGQLNFVKLMFGLK